MKTSLLIILLFFISIHSNCQSAIDIQYTRESLYVTPEDYKIKFMPRMVFNDSFALVYYFDETDKNDRPGEQIGHKLMHHGTFYNFITNEKLWEIDWSNKEKYLVKDTTAPRNWQFFNNERTVLNKVCHAALSVGPKGDSILVWYTKDLGFQKGPLFYDGIPGVVLEVFDQKWHFHFLATEINERKIKLVPPAEGKNLSSSEWLEVSEARQRFLNKMGS